MMSDWFEYFNDHVEENAGGFAALGGMAHLRNQNAQKKELQEQRKLLQEQLASAKSAERTEQERLAIEKRRFEIEQKEREIIQQKAESTKEMRKVMAGVSRELDQLENLIS